MSFPSFLNGPGRDEPGQELSLQWRSSRHARRLLTLGLAALFIATVARLLGAVPTPRTDPAAPAAAVTG